MAQEGQGTAAQTLTATNDKPQTQVNQPPAQGTAAAAGGGDQAPAFDYKKSIAGEYHGLWENKGWKDPNDVLKSYGNLENMLGAQDRLILPKDDKDDKAWGELYTKLGRPAKADDYKFDDLPQGMELNQELDKWFRETSFANGLSQKAAAAMQREFNKFGQVEMARLAAEKKAAAEKGLAELKKEWGADFDDGVAKAKMAAKALGGDKIAAAIDALEGQMGFPEVIRMFNALAKGMGEDKFVQGDIKGTGAASGKSQAQAVKEIETLMADPDYLSGQKNPARHEMLKKQVTELFGVAYGNEPLPGFRK